MMFEQKVKKDKKEKRFKVVSEEAFGFSGVTTILLDQETGVNYLVISGTAGEGITPLLDAEGKVVITPVVQE